MSTCISVSNPLVYLLTYLSVSSPLVNLFTCSLVYLFTCLWISFLILFQFLVLLSTCLLVFCPFLSCLSVSGQFFSFYLSICFLSPIVYLYTICIRLFISMSISFVPSCLPFYQFIFPSSICFLFLYLLGTWLCVNCRNGHNFEFHF